MPRSPPVDESSLPLEERFALIDRRHAGFLGWFTGGGTKAANEKMLILGQLLRDTNQEVLAMRGELGSSYTALKANLDNLDKAEKAVQEALQHDVSYLEGTITRTTEALSSGEAKRAQELTLEIGQSTAQLRSTLEQTGDTLKQANKDTASALAAMGKTLASVEAHVSLTEAKVVESLAGTQARLDKINESTQTAAQSVLKLQTDSAQERQTVEEIRKNLTSVDKEAQALEAELAQARAALSQSLDRLQGEVDDIETRVQKLPTESSISKEVRHELGRRLLDDSDVERVDFQPAKPASAPAANAEPKPESKPNGKADAQPPAAEEDPKRKELKTRLRGLFG